MSLTKTPICDFGKKAENFQLNYYLQLYIHVAWLDDQPLHFFLSLMDILGQCVKHFHLEH